MAYIQPNSVIQLFQGINLDNRYMHTIYFANEAAQNSWFSGKVHRSYQAESYTRYTRNQIKLKVPADEVIGCTYLRFMNNRTVDKWFYAFILASEYVNENTTLITYEIDVMQTWFIQNGTVRPCMIRREHVSNDTFSSNLEPEPVGSEQYEMSYIKKSNHFDNYDVVINSSAETQGAITNNGIFNGTDYEAVPMSPSPQTAVTVMYRMLGSWDKQQQTADILDMFMFPSDFSSDNKEDNKYELTIDAPSSFGGYVPKNNKLFTYPYSFLHVTTKNGDARDYLWEYFSRPYDVSPRFNLYGNPLSGGSIICYPEEYQGVTNNHDAKLSMDNFPKCAFAYDAYQAWIAAGGKTRLQNEQDLTDAREVAAGLRAGANYATELSHGFINAGVGATELAETGSIGAFNRMVSGANEMVVAQSNLIDAAANIVEARNKINYQWKDASYRPNTVVGKSSPNICVSLGILDFYFYHPHIRAEQAKHIDDFFSMYGYAINKVKQPNLTGRAYWNFIQTENCVVNGNMPSSSKAAIEKIFDGGITFWHNGDNVGNYAFSVSDGSINNPII